MATRVFSPSSTETFAKCPRKWALNREGWKPRVIGYPELCAVLGDGFSSSMHFLNKGLIANIVPPLNLVIECGQLTMKKRLEADLDAGRRINSGKDEAYADSLPMLLEKAVNLYVKADPLKDWTILQAELSYPDHGNARIDLLASDSLGAGVFDYKVKVSMEEKWEAKTVAQFANSHQRFHYQWCAGTKRFFIVLIVLGPKPYVKVCPFGDSRYFDSGLWERDASGQWFVMEQTRAARETVSGHLSMIMGSPIHQDQYGPCEYEEACLEMGLDEQLMNISYVKIERRV